MIFGDNDPDLIGVDLDDLTLLGVDGQLGDAEIGKVVLNGLEHARAVAAIDVELDVGKLLFVFAEDFGKDVDAGGFVGGDDELTTGNAFEFLNGFLRAATEIEDLLGVLGEDLASGSESDAGTETLEKVSVEFLLQLTDLGADCGLRTKTRLCGFGKTLEPDNFEERVKLIQIHERTGY